MNVPAGIATSSIPRSEGAFGSAGYPAAARKHVKMKQQSRTEEETRLLPKSGPLPTVLNARLALLIVCALVEPAEGAFWTTAPGCAVRLCSVIVQRFSIASTPFSSYGAKVNALPALQRDIPRWQGICNPQLIDG